MRAGVWARERVGARARGLAGAWARGRVGIAIGASGVGRYQIWRDELPPALVHRTADLEELDRY